MHLKMLSPGAMFGPNDRIPYHQFLWVLQNKLKIFIILQKNLKNIAKIEKYQIFSEGL